MKAEFRTFAGGCRFNNFVGQLEAKIEVAEIPAKVTVPFKQGFGAELAPLIKPGDRVGAGEIMARDDDVLGSPIHAPRSFARYHSARYNVSRKKTRGFEAAEIIKGKHPKMPILVITAINREY